MDTLIEAVKDFFREKKVVAIFLAILIFFLLTALIITALQNVPEKVSSDYRIIENFEADNSLEIPDGPIFYQSYYPARDAKGKWTIEETKEYFTIPDGSILEELEVTNDLLTKDILESAP